MEQVIAPKPLHSPRSEAEAPWSIRRSGNKLPAPCSPAGDHKQGWSHLLSPFLGRALTPRPLLAFIFTGPRC